jgi:hypothetical protein
MSVHVPPNPNAAPRTAERTIQFIRRAGQAGLLTSPTPPAARLAELAAGNGHPTQVAEPAASDTPNS